MPAQRIAPLLYPRSMNLYRFIFSLHSAARTQTDEWGEGGETLSEFLSANDFVGDEENGPPLVVVLPPFIYLFFILEKREK